MLKKDAVSASDEVEPTIERRTIMKGAAWSIPVIALTTAVPSASASDIDLGAFRLNGSCGVLGLLGPGFTLTAGPTQSLPVGTTVTITGSGVANIGVFSVTGGTANVTVLGSTGRQITLTSSVPAGASIAFRSTLSITVAFTLSAVVSTPAGYTATGAKTSGSVSSTLILCSAN